MTEPPPTPGCESCGSRDVVIVAQAKAIEELTAANARLVERVTALERIVGRNSGNSSMPPSCDDLPGRKKPQSKPVKGSGRKRGKQPGAAGNSLPWVAVPDEHVAHRPHGDCGCGADLAEATEVAGHQACTAHLLRDFTDAAESHPRAVWPEQAQRAVRGLIHAWHDARDAEQTAIPAPLADPLISEFRHAIRVGLAQVRPNPGPRSSTAQPPGRTLLEFCRDHEGDVLAFCTDTRIWPTNNLSERDLRPSKTQQKISGRLTSEDVTQDRLDIRSYIDTIRKHKADVITGIRAALTGNPWRPPIPAPT